MVGSNLAQAETPATDAASTDAVVQVGLHGQTKLGAWFPIFVTLDRREPQLRYEIDTVDADGFPVQICGEALRTTGGRYECLMQSGRANGERAVRLFTETDGQTPVAQVTFKLRSRANERTIHPATVSLTAILEAAPMIAEELNPRRSSGGSPVISLTPNTPLPSNWLGWQTVQTLVISAENADQLQSLSTDQWSAVETWLERGGRLIVAAGPAAEAALQPGGALHRFCPGAYRGAAEIETSSQIEFFADANEQLIARDGIPIAVSEFESVQGRVELAQDSIPLVISNARGFGELVFVAMNLNDDRLQKWSGYRQLLRRIISPKTRTAPTPQRMRNLNQGSQVSHVGYTDLTGQLRLALDRFRSVPFVSFATIAALIGVYLLLIGPGDYFFLRKFIGRMELTWVTFPLISALFCTGAILAARWSRPADVRLNQLEIVDIDAASTHARSSLWAHFYSPSGGRCSLALPTDNGLKIAPTDRVLSWQGLPGDGLGGMSTRAANSFIGQSYRQSIRRPTVSDQANLNIKIQDQPLRVSTTRSLFGSWHSGLSKVPDSNLRLNQRTKHIEGTFTNPLEVPLKNGQLLFDDYLYTIEGTLFPGDEIDVLGDDLDEQTTRSFLNRRKKNAKDSNKARNLPWNPTSTRLDRLAEILMFYSASGGNEYVGLSHTYQPFVDLSEHLHLSRAILVGEVDKPITPLLVNGNPSTDQYDSVTTLVRILFPVETR